MAKRYRVTLAAAERVELEAMISRGKAAARKLAHARVLLLADEAAGGPGLTDADVAAAVRVSVATVERVRQRFVEQGLGCWRAGWSSWSTRTRCRTRRCGRR